MRFSVILACTAVLAACSAAVDIRPADLKLFAPLPPEIESPANTLTPAKLELGRMLYFETRLSKSQQVSCNTCHPLDRYGADGMPVSGGHRGQKGDRNSPSVYNAAGHFLQFWDGRAENVEEQAKGPVMNPVEMAMESERHVVDVLTSMPEYVERFSKAFPNEKAPVTFDNMAKAIAAFERILVTPARWDRFLKGEATAINDEEKAGFNHFVNAGCATCHAGPYVGGTTFQRLGASKPWADRSDLGRRKVTSRESDTLLFKVPSLRNVSRTRPYFHNGKIETLHQAIATMGEYQLGTKLTEPQIQGIGKWLETLTGEPPKGYIEVPRLPASTARTPKPSLSD